MRQIAIPIISLFVITLLICHATALLVPQNNPSGNFAFTNRIPENILHEEKLAKKYSIYDIKTSIIADCNNPDGFEGLKHSIIFMQTGWGPEYFDAEQMVLVNDYSNRLLDMIDNLGLKHNHISRQGSLEIHR
jgi:hypothetical protein